MYRLLLASCLGLGLVGCATDNGPEAQQALVDRATLTVQEMLGVSNRGGAAQAMAQARAVMICPEMFKAGFVIGGSGGECVLVARDGAGSWSAPAFYAIGSGSFGPQIGVQDSELIMMILTRRGLSAIMDSQFKFGGDASVAVATIGAGVEGATTAALNADIVAYSNTRGLFAGVSLNGTILTSDTEWNRAYYGMDLAARQIVVQAQVNNPGDDPLRGMLSRYGAAAPVSYRRAPAYSQGYAPAQPGYGSQPDTAPYVPEDRGGVSQQDLAPPSR